MFRKFIAAFMTILFAASIHTTAFAEDEPKLNVKPGEVIKATGEGHPPKNWNPNNSFAKTFARQAARMDALRILAEMIGGAKVTAESVIVNDKRERDHVEGTLIHDSKVFKLLEKNARQVGDVKFYFNDKGKLTCEVTMELVVPPDWKN
ncbi:MAG: hypothetical protein IJ685_07300 [Selenomonadaceae bacterium]|nr:hypothetical protein [Selenomonadaceae bacterium]